MPIDPDLLQQALRTPESQDVTETPIVRAVILTDPANAADLVPSLDRSDSLEARNARRILAQFEADAVPHLLTALAATPGARARKEGLETLWTLLSLEDARVVRQRLVDSSAELGTLLRDTAPLPDEMPGHIERDFTGRICDLAYVVVRELLDREFDQSTFRALDDNGRDQAIRQLRLGGPGTAIV
jgi:hypothetical protein